MLLFHDYKALHIVGLLFFLMALVKLHSGASYGKFLKPFLFSSAFLTFSTGTILMVRWGLSNDVPPWIWGKYISLIGLLLSIWLPRPASRWAKVRFPFVGLMLIIGVVCSIYKPI
jgi:lipopolysaccharide export LptBFGC system permease protein LptF